MGDIDSIMAAKVPSDLFGSDPSLARDAYLVLMKRVHPSACDDPRAEAALSRLNVLYGRVKSAARSGASEDVDARRVVEYSTSTGSKFRASVIHARDGDREAISYTRTRVIYESPVGVPEVAAEHAAGYRLVSNFESVYSHRKEVWDNGKKYLPLHRTEFTTVKGTRVTAVSVADHVSLRDAVERGGPMHPKTAAWIASSAMDAVCFLHFGGVTHRGMTPDNVFVDPINHSVLLAGGWWFSGPSGATIGVLPRFVHSAARGALGPKKVANWRVDAESVKALVRYAVRGRTDVPKQVVRWMELPTGDDSPHLEYGRWQKARDAGFGAREYFRSEFTRDGIIRNMVEKEN